MALPGDFNLDNAVDAADYVAWRKGVEIEDTVDQYNLWRTNFGVAMGGGTGSSPAFVPEPSSAAVLVLAALLTSAIHRRRPVRVE